LSRYSSFYIIGKLASNVPAVDDDFATRKSKTVGFAGLQNCGGEKHHKGRIARLVFFGAQAANGGEALTGLLYDGFASSLQILL
jgi:hypothetical protein